MSLFGGSGNKDSDSHGDAAVSLEEIAEHVRELEDSVERLNRTNRAMWRILEQNLGVDMNLLKNTIAAIEAEEEHIEGSNARKARLCTNCERPLPKKASKCQYCGQENELTDVFDEI